WAHEPRRRLYRQIELARRETEGPPRGTSCILAANQKPPADIDGPFADRLLQHADAGLSTAANDRQGPDDAFRMMRAIIKRIDMGALLFELALHVRVECFDSGFIIVTAGHAGLICNDEYVVSGLVQKAHGFGCALNPFELFGPVRIAAVDIQDAIAIEKCCWTRPRFPVGVSPCGRCLVTHWLLPRTYFADWPRRHPVASPDGLAHC